MEEDHTIKDIGPTAEGPEPTTIIKTGQLASGENRGSSSRLVAVGVVLIISLLIAGLFLPPVSLGQRLGLGSDSDAVAGGSEVSEEELAVHTQESSADVSIRMVPASELGASEDTAPMAEALPAGADFASSVYLMRYEGDAPTGSVDIAVPEDGSAQTLDLFGWDGSHWSFIPLHTVSGTRWESANVPLPQAVVLIESGAPANLSVGAEVLPTQELPAAILPPLTEVAVGTLTLGADGKLQGDVTEVVEGGYQQYARATNLGIVVDQVSLATLLENDARVDEHVDALVNASDGFAGLNLDYQAVPTGQREAFTAFVTNLAAALHEDDRQLLVTLGTPLVTDTGQWDTGGQDWQAIGAVADAVYLQMPLNPAAYSEEGAAQQLVQWAVTQINRHKLNLLVTANAVDAVGSTFRELPNNLALANFGELSLVEGSEAVQVDTPIEVSLASTAGPLEWDGDSLMYRYVYEQAGQDHTVWLSNEAALSNRIRFVAPYHLRGVTLRGLGDVVEGEGYAQAVESVMSGAEAPEPNGAAIVWTVEDEGKSVVASDSGEDLSYRWQGAEEPGSYTINAVFAQGDAVAQLGSLDVDVEAPPSPTPTATPKPTQEPTVAAAAPAATAAPPVTGIDPGSDDAVNNIASNFRKGPGLGYAVIEVLPAGTKLSLIGRNAASDWFQVRVVNSDKEGWLFHNLLTVNSSVDTNALEVVEVEPPTVGDGPAPPPPPPIANTGFELGGQTHTLANPTLMQQAGMNWVKFQHKWSPGDSPDAVAGRIGHAHGNGFKVLLSIPGSSAYPNSIDFNAYVEFLRGVAALGPDAIEIWNEMNIDFEWPAGQIDPNSYVNNMLRPAYQAIKSVNPNVMVISGAPAPTGYDNGTNAWADDRYMAGVAAAGGANYMDCIGVHHNAGATSPSATSGHPAGNNHYSWYFMPTLNMYYNAFGGSRPVCFTELGYLSGQDFGGVPSRFSWAAGTTVSQHAQWLGEAVSLAGNSGKVRLVIVFNVDFTTWGDDPQAGYAILRPDGSCPACSTLSAAMGR
ncbi:MAG TPA: SH3 domain-containing protein [Candidatus Binatia bacterium]|nr:SH3 domain-containing protein [Candidatus Binatia bacterium]